ncbi:hypothetical protein JCM3770_000310 [Rhodotorula araucariae]
MSPNRASLDTLPPELLASIFSLSSTRHGSPAVPLAPAPLSAAFPDPCEPLRLSPTAVPISRALVPFARANAYQRLTVHGPAALAALGAVLAERDGLAALVRTVEVRDSARGERGRGVDIERVKVAFDALCALETLVLALATSPALLAAVLSPAVLASARAFGLHKGVGLVVHSASTAPVYVPVLAGVLHAQGVCELRVTGRMGVKLGPGEDRARMDEALRVAAAALAGERDAATRSGVERVVLEVEPHATGLSTFLDALPRLTHLSLRCFTADAVAVFSALSPRTRARLTSVEYSSSGYLHRELADFATLLPCVEHLTLTSSSLLLSPVFLASLAACPRLASLTLAGPHLAGETPAGAGTVQLVAEWIEHLAASSSSSSSAVGAGAAEGNARGALRTLAVDVPCPPGVAVFGTHADGDSGGGGRRRSRVEAQATRLGAACERAGVALGGSVVCLVASRG